MRIGGIASATSAIVMLSRDSPKNARLIAISARLGSARKTLEMLIASNAPRVQVAQADTERQREHERDRDPIAAMMMCSHVRSSSRLVLSA